MKRPTEMHLMDFFYYLTFGANFFFFSFLLWNMNLNLKKKSIENLEKVLSIKKEEAVTVFSWRRKKIV